MILASAGALAGLSAIPSGFGQSSDNFQKSGIPLLHITDLYHPPQDPDDHLDLLTVAALDEFDLKGVILDATQKFLDPAPAGFDIARDPGFIPVAQLGHLLGRRIPAASGPTIALKSPTDPATDRPDREQAGIRMLIDVLRESPEQVLVSCAGSVRVLTAAFNREPELLRSKVKAVLLNAGSTGGTKREWNVGLDLSAYVGLWRSGLPIHWYPCATERSAFNIEHERGTYWKASQAELFRNLPQSLRAWIAYNFMGERSRDSIRALSEEVNESVWEKVCSEQRNMWSTASLVMAAGRVLAHTKDQWRFLPSSSVNDLELWPWRIDAIDAKADEEGRVDWRPTPSKSHYKLFGRKSGTAFGTAMAEALNALLRSLPL